MGAAGSDRRRSLAGDARCPSIWASTLAQARGPARPPGPDRRRASCGNSATVFGFASAPRLPKLPRPRPASRPFGRFSSRGTGSWRCDCGPRGRVPPAPWRPTRPTKERPRPGAWSSCGISPRMSASAATAADELPPIWRLESGRPGDGAATIQKNPTVDVRSTLSYLS